MVDKYTHAHTQVHMHMCICIQISVCIYTTNVHTLEIYTHIINICTYIINSEMYIHIQMCVYDILYTEMNTDVYHIYTQMCVLYIYFSLCIMSSICLINYTDKKEQQIFL